MRILHLCPPNLFFDDSRLTGSILAFVASSGNHLRFVVVGLLTDSVLTEVKNLIGCDPRVSAHRVYEAADVALYTSGQNVET